MSTTGYASLKVDFCKKDTILVAIVHQCHHYKYMHQRHRVQICCFSLCSAVSKTKLRNRPRGRKSTSIMGLLKKVSCVQSTIVQHPRRKCDFEGSLRDNEVLASTIDDVIVAETRFYPLMDNANERSVVNVMEVTEKEWRSIVAPLDMNYRREQMTN